MDILSERSRSFSSFQELNLTAHLYKQAFPERTSQFMRTVGSRQRHYGKKINKLNRSNANSSEVFENHKLIMFKNQNQVQTIKSIVET